MAEKRKLTHRQRLMARTIGLSLVVLALAAGFIFYRNPARRYRPEEQAAGITSELARGIPGDHPRVSFLDVGSKAGIAFRHFSGERSTQLPEDMGSGAAWGDYDNDGDDDLFIANISGPLTAGAEAPAACSLYRNNGDGTFTDLTGIAGLNLSICGQGATWGDFDGDGQLDLAITAYPDLYLFRNNGNGAFTNVSARAGLERFKGFWTGASWGDYNRDGYPDLYVCGYVQYSFNPDDWNKASLQFQAEVPFTLNPSSYSPERNLLFRNRGNGTFIEVGNQAGVDNPTGRSLAASWCDFDDDGWIDLYVANDVSDNALLRNLGNGRFEDISHAAWVADYRGAMGLGVGDWDGDGDFDIFVTHWIAQENALFNNMLVGFHGSRPGRLVFIDVADQYGLGQASLDFVKWGTSFFDYDNDGRTDLFVANGSTFQDEKDKRKLVPMRHLLFWNRNDTEGFFETSAISGEIFRQRTVGRGAAFADYDNDGDVDICVVNHGDRAWLLRNDGGDRNNWLKVNVRGRKNRFGIGAKIRIEAGGKTQIQQIGSQPSYLSSNSLTAHFGIGRAGIVDQVTVIFPDGRTSRLSGVKSNRTITVEEP